MSLLLWNLERLTIEMITPPKDGYHLSQKQIETVCNLKNAVYMGPWTIRTKDGGWSDSPVDVFYQETPAKPEFSNYFGIYRTSSLDSVPGMIFICDASSAFPEEGISAILLWNGEVIVSRYRHDYVSHPLGAMIDGGRDYTRYSLSSGSTLITLKVQRDTFVQNDKEICNVA